MMTDLEFCRTQKLHYVKDRWVRLVNVCHLLDHIMEDGTGMDYRARCAMVEDWARSYHSHYYSRPRDKFFISEALQEARDLGKSMVIIEDLS